MSVEALSHVLNKSVGDSTRKLVLVGLANHASKDGTAAWPSVKTLAAYADCSPRTVQRHIAALLDGGHIREGDQQLVDHLDARHRPIVYDVAMDAAAVDEWAGERAAGVTGRRDVSQAAGSKRASVHVSGGDNLSPLDGSSTDATVKASESRGDNLSPLSDAAVDESGVTPVTPRGDTHDTSRGDTGVTQTVPMNLPSTVPSSDPSLRSGSADAADGALPGMPEAPAAAKAPNPMAIAAEFLTWYETNRNGGMTVPARDRTKNALAKSYIGPALDAGASVDEVKKALANCRSEFPSQPEWRQALTAARTGNVIQLRGPGARQAYDDTAAHGTTEERIAARDASNAKTDEELAAEARAAFEA